MARPKSKSVTVDGIKHASDPGHLTLRANKDRALDRGKSGYTIRDIDKIDAISVEMAHCTAFAGRTEALQMVGSLARAGYRQWGDEWLAEVRRWVEAVDAQ